MEQGVNPSESPAAGAPQRARHPWFAVMVRASHAHAASASLERLGYEQFRPAQSVRKQWSDRVKVVEEPLFPGYLFCRFDPQHRLPILTAPGIISIVSFGKQLAPVDEGEIETVRTLLKARTRVCQHPYLQTGKRVRIEHGALAGVEGILLEVRNEYRVVASITILQRSVAVEIDPARLRVL